jgi:transcriptional regulator with XRE-family HTH domain
MSDVISHYTRTLGDVLRGHRKARGWTRKELRAQLPDTADISIQTLATYELGTRRLCVDRLDNIAHALGTRAHLILAEVDRRVHGAWVGHDLVVDLATLATSTRHDIVPAARWAATKVAARDGIAKPVVLTLDALDKLAEICGLGMPELFVILRDFQPKEMIFV